MSLSSGKDLTRGNAAWNLLNFTVPFLLAFFLQIFYGTVDVIAVGRFGGGSSDVSAVASGSEVMQLVASLIAGLTTGATVLIGQCYGAKDYQSVNRCIGMTLSVSLLASLLLTGVMVPMIPQIARWLNTPPEAFEQTVAYGTICSWGIVFIFGYNALSAIFRGLGNSTAPLIFVGIACVVNIIGDLLLVIVFQMGVTGVAIATVSSQALSMIFALIFLYRGDFGFRFQARNFRISWQLAWCYAKIGIPIGVQGVVVGLSFLFIFTIVNSMGLPLPPDMASVTKSTGLRCFRRSPFPWRFPLRLLRISVLRNHIVQSGLSGLESVIRCLSVRLRCCSCNAFHGSSSRCFWILPVLMRKPLLPRRPVTSGVSAGSLFLSRLSSAPTVFSMAAAVLSSRWRTIWEERFLFVCPQPIC